MTDGYESGIHRCRYSVSASITRSCSDCGCVGQVKARVHQVDARPTELTRVPAGEEFGPTKGKAPRPSRVGQVDQAGVRKTVARTTSNSALCHNRPHERSAREEIDPARLLVGGVGAAELVPPKVQLAHARQISREGMRGINLEKCRTDLP